MPARRLYVLAALVSSTVLGADHATAIELVPHRAVYDLSLAEQSAELVGVEGRIAIEMGVADCEVYDLDYRFVARFGGEDEMTLTDQRIRARESIDGRTYEFEALSFVDGIEQPQVDGTANTDGDETTVTMRAPVTRDFAIRAALFPLGHTRNLIEAARAGQRIVQTPLYDGDADGENLLTTTAILLPLEADTPRPAGLDQLAGWRVDESYFDQGSDADGLPSFHTRYTLFENGVSDDLYLDFGEYALEGGISELTLAEMPVCP